MSSRLSAALFVSLAGHALLAGLLAGAATPPGTGNTIPLTATLLASGEAAPRPAQPRTALPSKPVAKVERSRNQALTGAATVPERTLATALVTAPVTEPLTEPTLEPMTEPGSVMSLPRQGQIRYVLLQGGQLVGHRLEEWRHDGSTYTIESRTETSEPAGNTLAQSSGVVSSDGLVPLAYHDEARREVVNFDWQTLRAAAAWSGEPPVLMALHGDTQDRLSLPYQIGQAMVHGKRLTAAVASGAGLLRESFEVVSNDETLVAGVGLPSLHVQRRPNSPDSGILELWLSLDGQYLPLRIRRIDRLGRELDQIAEKIDYDGMR